MPRPSAKGRGADVFFDDIATTVAPDEESDSRRSEVGSTNSRKPKVVPQPTVADSTDPGDARDAGTLATAIAMKPSFSLTPDMVQWIEDLWWEIRSKHPGPKVSRSRIVQFALERLRAEAGLKPSSELLGELRRKRRNG